MAPSQPKRKTGDSYKSDALTSQKRKRTLNGQSKHTGIQPHKRVEAQSPDPPPTRAQTEETAGTPGDVISVLDSEGERDGQTITGAGQAAKASSEATTNDDEEMDPSDLSEDEKVLREYSLSYLELMR